MWSRHEWKRMVNFPDWLNAVAGPAHPATGAAAPTTDRFAKAGNWRIPVSEFGRKMDPVAGTPAPPEPKTPPIPSEPHPPVPEPPAPVVGEFTRMFEAAKQNQPPAGPARTEQIGEFTRMFEAQNPSAASNAGSSANETPGEFTRMFDVLLRRLRLRSRRFRVFRLRTSMSRGSLHGCSRLRAHRWARG